MDSNIDQAVSLNIVSPGGALLLEQKMTLKKFQNQKVCALVSLALGLSLWTPLTSAGVFDWFFSDEEPTIVRAKGTVANIALPLSHRIASKKFTWVPPSTALLLDEEYDEISGKRLALSAHGMWIYVAEEDYESNMLSSEIGNALVTTKKLELPLENDPVSVVIPKGITMNLAEPYNGRGPFTARIDASLISGLRPDKAYTVTIDRNSARIPRNVQGFDDIDFFTRAFLREKLTGFRASSCNSVVTIQNASAINFDSELSGGRDFGAIKAEITLKASTSQQVEETINFPKDKKTHVFVYKKSRSNRVYLFSEYESCVDDSTEFRIELIDFENPAQIVINANHPADFKRDARTNKLLITCDTEYDRVNQFLAADFPQADVPFLVSLVSEWKHFGDMSVCR